MLAIRQIASVVKSMSWRMSCLWLRSVDFRAGKRPPRRCLRACRATSRRDSLLGAASLALLPLVHDRSAEAAEASSRSAPDADAACSCAKVDSADLHVMCSSTVGLSWLDHRAVQSAPAELAGRSWTQQSQTSCTWTLATAQQGMIPTDYWATKLSAKAQMLWAASS